MSHYRRTVNIILCLLLSIWAGRVSSQDRPAEVGDLIQALGGKSPEERLEAVSALGRLGPRAADAIPSLIGALNDQDIGVRWSATIALARIGPAAVIPLTHALADTQENIRLGAATAFCQIGPDAKEAVPSLLSAMKDQSGQVREKAAEALGRIGTADQQIIDSLVQSLSDPDPYFNGQASDALSKIGKGAVPVLIQALKDANDNVRWCAAIALSKMGQNAADAIPALIQSLKDKNENVRWSSVIALGTMSKGGEEAVPALLLSLHDEDNDVRWGAYKALERINPEALRKRPDLPSVIARIEKMIPDLMKELHVPGVSIAIIGDRKLAWSKGYGFADVKEHKPVTTGTLFEACSMTKPVFAYTVMQLVEQKKLDLDRPLIEYLDEPSLFSQPLRALITARTVLSHTSGLPNWRKGEEERDGPIPVLFTPGSTFSYSGEGIYYLQRVVESITGEPLEVYARRTLFKPLGLDHMSYVWTEELDPNIASGHKEDGTFLQKTRYTHASAAYSLYTTADDYAKVLIEIMKTDRTAAISLSQKYIDTMLTRQIGLNTREPIERPGRAMGLSVFWGLGWSINSTKAGDIIHHSGANRSGFRCFSQFNPAEGSGIVIMTNSLSGGDLWSRLIREIGDL